MWICCAAWPALIAGLVLGGLGCWIVAEQHDRDRSMRIAGWSCFLLATVVAVLPFLLPSVVRWLRG